MKLELNDTKGSFKLSFRTQFNVHVYVHCWVNGQRWMDLIINWRAFLGVIGPHTSVVFLKQMLEG